MVLFFTLSLTSCFSKTEKSIPLTATATEKPADSLEELPGSLPRILAQPKIIEFELFKKEQREAIYFSAGLEKEALKLLTKNPTFDELTLFSVLSYALETNHGVKKSPPVHLDCSRFRFVSELQKPAEIESKISVFKTCQKPESRIAEISIGKDQTSIEIKFLAKEWISVLGLSSTLSGNNVLCQLRIENKKLASLRCENWIRTLGVTNTSAEELRLGTFVFERKSLHQFLLKGGIYKDLVERKKIEIEVPLEGKIKRFEKEIEVIDQYLEAAVASEKPSAETSRPTRMQVMPETNPQPELVVPDRHPEPRPETLEAPESGGVPASPRQGR